MSICIKPIARSPSALADRFTLIGNGLNAQLSVAFKVKAQAGRDATQRDTAFPLANDAGSCAQGLLAGSPQPHFPILIQRIDLLPMVNHLFLL